MLRRGPFVGAGAMGKVPRLLGKSAATVGASRSAAWLGAIGVRGSFSSLRVLKVLSSSLLHLIGTSVAVPGARPMPALAVTKMAFAVELAVPATVMAN